MKFDFDKAVAALTAQTTSTNASQAFLAKLGLAALNGNKAAFQAMSEEAAQAALAAYFAGDDSAVVNAVPFDQMSAAMVTGSAAVANQQYNAKERFLALAKVGATVIATVLAAGMGF